MKKIYISVLLLFIIHACGAMESQHAEEKNKLVIHCEEYLYDLSAQLEEKEKNIQELKEAVENGKQHIVLLQDLLDDKRVAYENLESAKQSYVCAYQNVAAENRKLKETIAMQQARGLQSVPSCEHCLEMKKILIYNIQSMAQSKIDSRLALAWISKVSSENETLKKRLRELEQCCPTRK